MYIQQSMSNLACINSEFSVVLCATSLQTRTQCDAQLGPVSWWIAKASGMWGEWLEHKHDFNLVIHPISSLLRLLYRSFPAFRVCREGLCLRHNTTISLNECDLSVAQWGHWSTLILQGFAWFSISHKLQRMIIILQTNVRLSAPAGITYDIWKWLEYF